MAARMKLGALAVCAASARLPRPQPSGDVVSIVQVCSDNLKSCIMRSSVRARLPSVRNYAPSGGPAIIGRQPFRGLAAPLLSARIVILYDIGPLADGASHKG
jgi:hypothetical protein